MQQTTRPAEKARPRVASHQEWREARLRLLAKEKELTRLRDEANAARRRLPMVEVDEAYTFHGPEGDVGLGDLFEGRGQLIVYHFMFDPDWEEGCPSCSFLMDNVGHLAHLHARDTSFAAVSRAPIETLEAYRRRMGWTFPWYSSGGSDFNYDFHVTLDPAVAPVEYNYVRDDETEHVPWPMEGHGVSAFLREGERVFHTYSTYARGADILVNTYNWLDLTARGRQEDWEEPAGRSDGPMMSWLRRHDQYEDDAASAGSPGTEEPT